MFSLRYKILGGVTTALLLGSCDTYRSSERPTVVVPDSLYRNSSLSAVVIDSTVNYGNRPWRELFTSPRLQGLIERALTNNTDLRVAQLRIEQAEASLRAARGALLPSLAFSPQGTVSSFDGTKPSYTYSLPLTATWQADIFGRLRNAKEQQRMLLEGSKAYSQAVQTQLIATVAREYYRLSLLRSQLQVTTETSDLWKENVRAMCAFMQEGQYTEAAVSQAEAHYQNVCASVLDLKRQIAECENSLSTIVGDVPHDIASGAAVHDFLSLDTKDLAEWQTIKDYSIGVPLQLLSSRPDIRQAEMNLAAAFYATNEARAAFYPSITLSGSAGWTNSAGIITNPGKILLQAIGSLTQPIFQNGQLKANLRIAESQQEEAKLQFRQSLLNAGKEVNDALTQIQTYQAKTIHLQQQQESQQRTVNATRLLMESGSSSYLEVLNAQQNLLSARLSLVQNQYDEITAFIALYQALGGGRE